MTKLDHEQNLRKPRICSKIGGIIPEVEATIRLHRFLGRDGRLVKVSKMPESNLFVRFTGLPFLGSELWRGERDKDSIVSYAPLLLKC